MMQIKQQEAVIKREIKKLKNNVKLLVFTDAEMDAEGNIKRKCIYCDTTINLLNQLSEFSDGKLSFDELSIQSDKEIAEKYKIDKVPTIIFPDKDGNDIIKYIGNPLGLELIPFIHIIQFFSGIRSYYEDAIFNNLKNMRKTNLKLFITLSCPYCPSVVPVAGLFAILSKGKVKTEIIDVDVNPELALKYQIRGVPHVILNDSKHIYGVFYTARPFR
ncbi:MAG: thioredoxin family protein [Promethearchaeota archaeon]